MINIVQIGMGPLGQKMVNFISQRSALKITGAVDNDPQKIGKTLKDLCGIANGGDIKIVSSLKELVDSGVKIDAALLTTVSSLEKIAPQIEGIVSLGIPVVSTCEELSYPWETNPEVSRKIDEAAKKNNVAVVGTGVNPGFLMDFLPLSLTAVCQDVKSIKVERIQDATFRRVPFQRKIGAGLSLQEFDAKKKNGTLRHVGLTESIHMIASRMNWKLDKVTESLEPVIAEKELSSKETVVKAGDAAGVEQIGRGFTNGEEKITLHFRAAIGQKEPHDSVEIKGEPSFTTRIEGGVNGDVATCAITINAVKQILRSSPGLMTMADIPAVSFFS